MKRLEALAHVVARQFVHHGAHLLQLSTQRLPRARQPRLDGADRDAEREGDFVVAQAVDLAQHDHRALIERQLIERRPQPLGQLLARKARSGDGVVAGLAQVAVRGHVLVERHLVGLVAPPPPALAVARLVDDDAVDPGLEGRLAAEVVDGAEDAEEDFLGEVEGLVAVAQQVQGQLEDHALVAGHQLGAGRLLARGAALDERRFAVVRPQPIRVPRRLS